MKKKIKLILTMMLVLVVLPFKNITAATGSVSISGPSELAPGTSGTYTISFSADDTAYFQYSISGSNISISGTSSGIAPGDGTTRTSQVVITATAGSVGDATITASVNIATTGANPVEFSRSAPPKKVLVVAPTTNPDPVKPDNSGNSGNSTGNTSKPNLPTKTPEEIAAEKEAEEKAAKDLAQKTPLIKSIEVLSMSPKKYNQALVLINPESDTWNYEFSLPKRIEDFDLEIVSVDDDVTLNFDTKHTFKETTELFKEIKISAVKGDIVQEYIIKINKDVSIPVVIELDNGSGTLFEDEELDSFMAQSGFVLNTYKNASDQNISFFTLNDVSVQLVVNSENEAQWFLINEDNILGDPVSIQFDKDLNPLFILEASEELQLQTLHGNKYKLVSGKVDDILLNLDQSIKWKNDFKAWSVDDILIVYAMQSDGIRENFVYNEEKIKSSFVAFDKTDNSAKTIAIVSSTGFFAVSGYVLVTTLMNLRKRKNS